jgi:hypothetical protein
MNLIPKILFNSNRNSAKGTNSIRTAIVNLLRIITDRPPLWSSGQSSWLQIRRPAVDSRHSQKKVVGLELGPLSLVSITEEPLDRKNSGSCLEKREYGRRDPSR